MKFYKQNTEIFIPDGIEEQSAFKRITHLGVGAHQDDLELMAFDGILNCYDKTEHWFGGVTCTSGSGGPRVGQYAEYTALQMGELRKEEQKRAAVLGQYSLMIQLDYESKEIKGERQKQLVSDLREIFNNCNPKLIYTHNPADKHTTHVAVFWATLKALRELPKERRPEKLYGCEIWRDLDWLNDQQKIVFDLSQKQELSYQLISTHKSQQQGGRKYAQAIANRRSANATFSNPYDANQAEQISWAMDLTPLIKDDKLSVISYLDNLIENFKKDVLEKLNKTDFN